MGSKVEQSGTSPTPLRPRGAAGSPTAPLAPAGTTPLAAQPSQDSVRLSDAAKQKDPGEAKRLWDEVINNPVQEARDFLKDRSHAGGVEGFAAKAFGFAMDFSGVTSIARNTSVALDGTRDTRTRVKAAAWALGELAINFIPFGKVGGVGAKVFRVTGGAEALQALRNATKLGAEVKAGEKILHYTTAEGAEKIAQSGFLKGSERGFLTMGGKKRYLAVTREGLKRRTLNNGQLYALAADGKTTRAASVIDAIVGVAPETRLGKVLGKVSPAKTNYAAVVEHTLTPEEAARSYRWGKTIVTNVPPGWDGIPLATSEIGKIGRFGSQAVGKVSKNQTVSLGPIDHMISSAINHKDMAAYAYLRLLAMQHKPQI